MEEIQKAVPPNDEILWISVTKMNQLAGHTCVLGVFLTWSIILMYLIFSGSYSFPEDGFSFFFSWTWPLCAFGLVWALVDCLKTRRNRHATIKQLWMYCSFKILTTRFLIKNGYYLLNYQYEKDKVADLERSALIERQGDIIRVPLQNVKAINIDIYSDEDSGPDLGISFYSDPCDVVSYSRPLFGESFGISPPRYASSEFDEFWNKLARCFQLEEMPASPTSDLKPNFGEKMESSPSEFLCRKLNSRPGLSFSDILDRLNPLKMVRNAFKQPKPRPGIIFRCAYKNSE